MVPSISLLSSHFAFWSGGSVKLFNILSCLPLATFLCMAGL